MRTDEQNREAFLSAEAAYLAPPEDEALIREQWYETIDPVMIADALVDVLFVAIEIPSGWRAPLVKAVGDFLDKNIGDELGAIGAELDCNLTYEAYREGPEPDPDRDRDEAQGDDQYDD